MFNDPDSLQTISKAATWGAIVFGLLAALAATASWLATSRAEAIKERIRQSRPEVEASLQYSGEDKVHLVIDSKNLIPFECQWVIVTKKDIIVTGVRMDWTKVFPEKKAHVFRQVEEIDSEIVDGFLELRFNYRSLHFAELKRPDLAGRIVRPYQLSDDKMSLIPL